MILQTKCAYFIFICLFGQSCFSENLICRELTDRMGGLVDSIFVYKLTFLHLF